MDCFVKKLLFVSLGIAIPLLMAAEEPSTNTYQKTTEGTNVSAKKLVTGDDRIADAIDKSQTKARVEELMLEDELFYKKIVVCCFRDSYPIGNGS